MKPQEAAITLINLSLPDYFPADLDREARTLFPNVRRRPSRMQTIAGILHFLPQPAAPADWLINGRSACRWKNVCPQLNILCFQPACFFFSLLLILNKGPVKTAIKYALCCCILYPLYRNKNTDSTRVERSCSIISEEKYSSRFKNLLK